MAKRWQDRVADIRDRMARESALGFSGSGIRSAIADLSELISEPQQRVDQQPPKDFSRVVVCGETKPDGLLYVFEEASDIKEEVFKAIRNLKPCNYVKVETRPDHPATTPCTVREPFEKRPYCCITFTRKGDEHIATLRYRGPGGAVCSVLGCQVEDATGPTQLAALDQLRSKLR